MNSADPQILKVSEIIGNDNIFSLLKWYLGISEMPQWEINLKNDEPIKHNHPLPHFSKKDFSIPVNTQKGFEYIQNLVGSVCKVVSNLPKAIPISELPTKKTDSIPPMELAFEINNIGMLQCKADLLLARLSKTHFISGPSMLEDTVGIIFYDKNVDLNKRRKYSSKVFKKSFIYTIISTLLREKQIPVYLTSFGNLFLKSVLTITSKGILAVNYVYLNSDDFVKDVTSIVKAKSTVTTTKLNSAIHQLKHNLLPLGKRFYPFLLEDITQTQTPAEQNNEQENKSKKSNKKKKTQSKEGDVTDSTNSARTKADKSEVNKSTKDNTGTDSWEESSP